MVNVKDVLNLMDIVKNGRSLKDVQFISVQETITYNFAVYAKSSLVNG